MEAIQKMAKSNCIYKKLRVLNQIESRYLCSICNHPLFLARLEIWEENSLKEVDYNNYFCEKCGLFEYEPEYDAKIYFNKKIHNKIYREQLKSFY